MNHLLSVTETEITKVRELKEHWVIETKVALKFNLEKKWGITPDKGVPVKLFYARGGRLAILYIDQHIVTMDSWIDKMAS